MKREILGSELVHSPRVEENEIEIRGKWVGWLGFS